MVDVAHNGDHGSPRGEIRGIVDEDVGALLLLFRVLDLHLALELLRQDHDGVVGERLGDGDHLTQLDERLDELSRRQIEHFAQILDTGSALHLHGSFSTRGRFLLQSGLLRFTHGPAAAVAESASASALAAGLRIDDDPALGRFVVAPTYPRRAPPPAGLQSAEPAPAQSRGWQEVALREGRSLRSPPSRANPPGRGGRPATGAAGRGAGPRGPGAGDSGCGGLGGAAAAALRAASAFAAFSAWMRTSSSLVTTFPDGLTPLRSGTPGPTTVGISSRRGPRPRGLGGLFGS